MKVLQITTNYPCKENPIFGIFMKEQIESLEKYGVINKVIFSNGLKSNPKIKFSATFIHLKTALKLFYHLKFHKYDIIHCHSALSGLILKLPTDSIGITIRYGLFKTTLTITILRMGE